MTKEEKKHKRKMQAPIMPLEEETGWPKNRLFVILFLSFLLFFWSTEQVRYYLSHKHTFTHTLVYLNKHISDAPFLSSIVVFALCSLITLITLSTVHCPLSTIHCSLSTVLCSLPHPLVPCSLLISFYLTVLSPDYFFMFYYAMIIIFPFRISTWVLWWP